MKNSLILLTLFAGLLLFSSFRVNDSDQSLTLSGTRWVATGEGTSEGEEGEVPFTFTETLSFASDGTFSGLYTDSFGEKSDPKIGTYLYSHPNITLTFEEEVDGVKEVFSGTIDGNTMVFSEITFIRQ